MAINLLSENQASIETDLTGLSVQGAGVITRDTIEFNHGVASLKTVTGNAAINEGCRTTSIDVAPSLDYTESVFVKGSGTVELFLSERNAGDASLGSVSTGNIVLTDTWTRYSVTRTFGADGVKARFILLTPTQQGITFYIDCLQIEQASSASDWRLPSEGSASPSSSPSPSSSISLSPSSSQSPSSSLSLSPSVSVSLSSSLSPSPSWPGLTGTQEVS